MLAGYWENDPVSPKEEASLIANSSQQGKLLTVNFSPVYQNFHQALQQISHWLEHKLA